MTERREQTERRKNHALEFLKAYWFLIVFSAGAMGTVANLYFEIQYIAKAVNPDSIAEYGKEQAILETKRQVRWCLGKFLLTLDPGTPINSTVKERILGCAD